MSNHCGGALYNINSDPASYLVTDWRDGYTLTQNWNDCDLVFSMSLIIKV